jgi:predicted lipid-binding transport protein (Tim44 family)
MGLIRFEQQSIIANAIYHKRLEAGLESGDSDGDWSLAEKALNHFETPYRDSHWMYAEEDYDEYRKLFTKEYSEYIRVTKEDFEAS